ncbi:MULTISPECIES: restriction endonuclease subunit S [Clostridia]|jgi:type I restriction enzyme, S subunit|uniref:restriction endonuclease subunit S n=1 Tax=Clostridia TaxID=186801 RepID=UPI000E46E112|nr:MULTISPECIES: restriction endonuclease subunit S [Clostridia]RHR08570.1 restriction endonuclease subunit S [Ruminococcus sp. AF20-12LB]
MEVMMKELGEIITGNTPSKKTEAFWSSEDICFIKPDIIADDGINEIVDSNEYISENARKKARIVGKNSIFITCIGSIGKIGIASDGEYAFNQQINAIIPNDRVQPKYLAYNLLFNKPRFVAIANAPVVPIINKSQFGEFTVNIETDIDRQCEIVDVLDKFTQIIQQRNKEISALDELIKARFVEMFGDPVMNEKGWITKSLLDMGRCKNGMNFHYDDEGVEINCLGVGDFKELSIIDNTDELPTVSLKEMPSEEYLLKDDDIVFVRSNGNKALVGRSIAVYPGNVPTTFSGFCIRYRKHDNEIIVPYLLRALKADSMRMKMTGRGANIQNLNQQILGTLVIPVPPIELQNQFADFVKQVDKSKVKVQKALDETQKLFDSLMQQYFG